MRPQAPSSVAHPFESFLSGNAGNYVEEMYAAWKDDPASVHASWRAFFARVDAGAPPGATFIPPPTLNAGASLQAAAVRESELMGTKEAGD